MAFRIAPSGSELPCPPLPWVSKVATSQRRVLVTGAAGFIGYHSSLRLRKVWEAQVIGLDIFSEDHYSVQLKRDRAALLAREGVRMYRGDLCDGALLQSLFRRHDFTHVLHLAGHVGVRASVKDPAAYAATNVGCFLSLLDVLKDRKVIGGNQLRGASLRSFRWACLMWGGVKIYEFVLMFTFIEYYFGICLIVQRVWGRCPGTFFSALTPQHSRQHVRGHKTDGREVCRRLLRAVRCACHWPTLLYCLRSMGQARYGCV